MTEPTDDQMDAAQMALVQAKALERWRVFFDILAAEMGLAFDEAVLLYAAVNLAGMRYGSAEIADAVKRRLDEPPPGEEWKG